MRILLTCFEVACVLAVVAGVAMWSIPAALVVGGAAGVVGAERRLADAKPTSEDQR